jgi:DNA-binding beta-propeller fold protein YncE
MRRALLTALAIITLLSPSSPAADEAPLHRLLYVAVPGIRDQLEHGGKGLLVFDIDDHHRFLKRIPVPTFDVNGKTLAVKGICASAKLGLVYIATTQSLTCLDLRSEKTVWEMHYPGGCDRMSISPDSKLIYQPILEGDHWNVLDASTGEVVAKVTPKSASHNTVYGRDGKFCYLAGLGSPLLTVADTSNHTIARTVGPFHGAVRPFTVNGNQTLCFCCVNGLLGFEIGDLQSGQLLYRVEVPNFKTGTVARHGCPSHGVGLTPDEKQVWVCDAFNKQLHLFDNTVMPPKYLQSIPLRDEPGWITFTRDGQFAYPSTGEVIDTATRKIVAQLTDETGRPVSSEKLLEIDFRNGVPADNADQFGLGRVVPGN